MIRSRTLLAVPLLFVVAAPHAGCIGSFALTDKVFQWNRGLGSIIVQEVVFLAFVILPVYEVTVLADAIVLNLLEFLTGENPVAGAERPPREIVLAEGVTLSLEKRAGIVTAILTGATVEPMVRLYEVSEFGAVVRDSAGAVLFSAAINGAGGVAVTDHQGALLADYSPAQVAAAHQAFATGGGASLAAVIAPPRGGAVASESGWPAHPPGPALPDRPAGHNPTCWIVHLICG